MEEDVGVKAKVTRLRRRLSVEQSEDGIGGSPGPATPTKKRGGRLVKPQLELIDENTPVSSPRKTRRKSLATDAEEKVITPSRRSVRIKSNTSIVSDTLSVQATDTPRAKRAARRYSQTGSDNEGPATPARQTRRTRKDSASSVENQESGTLNKPLPVAEMVIEEEPENEVQKALNKSKSSPTAATEELSPNARKSKRLLEKRNRRSGSQKTVQDSSSCSIENKSLNISTAKEKVSTETESHSPSSSVNKSVKYKKSNDDLSESNISLLNTLETKSKRNSLNHNKSASALDTSINYKSKRNRTESWPAVTASIANEGINFSDSEHSKKRKEKSNRSFSATDDSSKKNKSNTSVHETNTSQSFLDTSSKRKKRKSETNIENAAIPFKDVQAEVLTPEANKISGKKTPNGKSGSTDVTSDMAMLFENRPDNVQISVYYEDSDSNSVVTGTANTNKKIGSEDQCVPEVDVIPNAENNILSNQVSDDNEKVSSTDVSISQLGSNDVNNSCEPMDIDETINEDILQKSLDQTNTHRQSLSSSRNSIVEEIENSKRKSLITGSATDTPDRSKNDKRKSSISDTAVDIPDQSDYDKRKSSISNTVVDTPDRSKNDKRKSSISDTAVDTPDQSKNYKRKSSISNTAVDTPDQSKNDNRKSSISNTAVDTPDRSKNDTRKSSISDTAVDTPDQSKNDKRKSSMSNTAVDTPDRSKNDHGKSSISNTAVDTPDRSKNDKRKSSISNTAVETPDQSKNDKRKSSISNAAVDTPDRPTNDKRKSLISNAAVDTPDKSINGKRKSSISNTNADTPDRSKHDKRTSSVSNSMADTPDLSKNENNKSTLILSQLKDLSTTSENLKSPKSALINEVLSKSDMNEKGNKKIFKGNLSANDVKGTPIQNSVQKLTMQTSTPIASEQICIKTKLEEQKQESASKKKSFFSKSINDTDSSEEDSDDEISVEKNEHLDDEAEEASDDYESGDSQDEEERMYVAEHEIAERGETLTSNDDASNDTDYEKDSFIVSSDAEDSDLLSGSGDDLSMSDNELSMSKKSKKKFNDRKLKEQKNASREMFESRHKLNTSDKNSPTPKTKKSRMRIDSSLLVSDEEVVVKTKKPNRMRLDSTLDMSVKVEETNVSLNKSNKNISTLGTSVAQEDTNTSLKKKKKKSMQDSVCNKCAVDENEITVCNESSIDNADPLQIQIKQEPKTPQKGLNMSVVQVQQDIESVQMTESNYILDQTGTDPLQATMAGEYTSDSSESEEIMQNYDSILNELNKDRKIELNNKNASLNMGKKSKKEPIIDQLNLTQSKKSKKNKDQSKDDSESKTVKLSEKKHDSDNEDSSSSIDLQLLFSEDNCGSDDEQMSQQNKADDDNMFIPLKKSPGKTNLRGSIGMNTSQEDATLNKSSKKNKKRSSSIGPAESVDEQEEVVNESILNKSNSKKKKQRASLTAAESQELEDNVSVSKNVNILLNESGMKKKKKHSLSEPSVEETQGLPTFRMCRNVGRPQRGTPNAVEPELNESTKKKKKRKSSLSAQTEGDLFFIDTTGSLQDSKDEWGVFGEPPLYNVYERKKKKKKNKLDDVKTKQNDECCEFAEPPLDNVYERRKKKKKNKLDDAKTEQNDECCEFAEPPLANVYERRKKKNKNKLDDAKTEQNDECCEFAEPPLDNVYERRKKKKKNKLDDAKTEQNENTAEESNAAVTPKSETKKKKHCISEPSFVESQENTIGNAAITPKSEKRKKKHSMSEPSAEETQENTVMTPKSEKKKKKHSTSEPPVEESQGNLFFIDTVGTLQDGKENAVEDSNAVKTPKSEKKKKQKLKSIVHDEDSDGAPDEAPYQSEKASEVDLQDIENVSESAETGSAKKKHKKKKKNSSAPNQSGESIDTENVTFNSKKRKRKSSNAESSQEDAQGVVESGEVNEFVGSNKKLKISHNEDNTSGSNESKQPKKNKKKNRNVNFQDIAASTIETTGTQTNNKKNKKRKHRDEDGDSKQSKVSKDSSFQEVHVPRLPDSILRQLDDKPRKIEPTKVVSTSNFIVENARQKRAKPSNYLEESIYLDAEPLIAKKEKSRIKKPKVLPFIPTASTSDSGFTTNFRINKLSQFTTFEAEPVVFSKENYLQKKKIKRLGTYDRFKTQMHHKMSKF